MSHSWKMVIDDAYAKEMGSVSKKYNSQIPCVDMKYCMIYNVCRNGYKVIT